MQAMCEKKFLCSATIPLCPSNFLKRLTEKYNVCCFERLEELQNYLTGPLLELCTLYS